MILGIRTVIYVAPDLGHGKEWYSQLLGFGPYFDQPYYVGFSVGAFELGLVPDGTPSPDGARVYWGVANAAQEFGENQQPGCCHAGSLTRRWRGDQSGIR